MILRFITDVKSLVSSSVNWSQSRGCINKLLPNNSCQISRVVFNVRSPVENVRRRHLFGIISQRILLRQSFRVVTVPLSLRESQSALLAAALRLCYPTSRRIIPTDSMPRRRNRHRLFGLRSKHHKPCRNPSKLPWVIKRAAGLCRCYSLFQQWIIQNFGNFCLK